MDDVTLRTVIYQRIVDTGVPPSRDELIAEIGDPDQTDQQLRRLHDAHQIVLDERGHRRGEIRMALPFAAEPTGFRVWTNRGGWWANCAWDSLAVLAALDVDGRIESTWADTGEPVDLHVTDGQLDRMNGHVHFHVPARHWWDDIVFT